MYYTVTDGYNFNIYCTNAGATEITNDVAIHAYIMGFRYEPDATGSGQFLAADASFGAWPLSHKSR